MKAASTSPLQQVFSNDWIPMAAEPTFLAWTPRTYDAIGVVVVAHNAERTIEACVSSLFAAYHFIGWKRPFWLALVSDGCTDHTAKLGRMAVNAFGEVLPIAAKSDDKARNVGAAAVLHHFAKASSAGLLLTHVFANARVPLDWFDTQLRLRAANECYLDAHSFRQATRL
jgi:hypothetical protein